MRFCYYFLFVGLFVPLLISAQPLARSDNYDVIIDTDAGMDDLRMITLFLSLEETSLKAVFTNSGVLKASDAFFVTSGLLEKLDKGHIPVAAGKDHPYPDYTCEMRGNLTAIADSLQRSKTLHLISDLIPDILEDENQKINYICTGPLTNLAYLLKNHEAFSSHINKVIWYNHSFDPLTGFNYESDKEAAEYVLSSGIRVDIISRLNKEEMTFGPSFLKTGKDTNTVYYQTLEELQKLSRQEKDTLHYCYHIADELCLLYLLKPSVFDMNIRISSPAIRYTESYRQDAALAMMKDIINNNYKEDDFILFSSFPVKAGLYTYDVRNIVQPVIDKYGKQEFAAVVLTSEIHGHMGVYSIVGAKMGIRAMELLGAGRDQISVVSHAGKTPPYSCLNDGILVSTGSTPGLGLLSVPEVEEPQPEAIFLFEGRKIRMKLKDKYFQQVERDIEEGIVKYGLMDEGYWKLIRKNSLNYWLEWSRFDIFEIEEID